MNLYLTRAADYGRMRLTANGRGMSFDAYADTVTVAGPVALRHVTVRNGRLLLRAELTGRNPRSLGMMAGFDCMTLIPEKP